MESAEFDPNYFTDPARTAWEQFFSTRHRLTWETIQTDRANDGMFRIFHKYNFTKLSAEQVFSTPLEGWLSPESSIEDELYDRMRPGLVLATKLLEQTGEFFDRIVFGNIVSSWGQRFCAPANELKAEFRGKFPDLHESLYNVQFCMGSDGGSDLVYGNTHHGRFPHFEVSQGNSRVTCVVQLSPRFRSFFMDPDYETFDLELKQRILFTLAVTIVHELAHVWYRLRGFEFYRQGKIELHAENTVSPFYTQSQATAELGEAWEMETFKYSLQLDEDQPFARSQNLVCDTFAKYYRPMAHPTYIVAPAVVAAFFEPECWTIRRRILPGGDLHRELGDVAGRYLQEVMETVACIRKFEQQHGRLPLAEEISKPDPVVMDHVSHPERHHPGA